MHLDSQRMCPIVLSETMMMAPRTPPLPSSLVMISAQTRRRRTVGGEPSVTFPDRLQRTETLGRSRQGTLARRW